MVTLKCRDCGASSTAKKFVVGRHEDGLTLCFGCRQRRGNAKRHAVALTRPLVTALQCRDCGCPVMVKQVRAYHKEVGARCRSCCARMLKGSVNTKWQGKSMVGRLYFSWKDMQTRCKREPGYILKGIRVCPEWSDFNVFYEWAFANGYSNEKHSEIALDRINPLMDYSPSNCRWLNRRDNVRRINILTESDVELILRLGAGGLSASAIVQKFYASTRKASPAAVKKNPNLKKVKG